MIQGPDGTARVGVTKSQIELRSVEDVSKLYKLNEFASKMEDKAARDARVRKSQAVLFEQAAEEKEQPVAGFHKQVIDNSANLEVLKTNMEAVAACNKKEPMDILARNLLLKYGAAVKICLEKQIIDAAKGSEEYSGSLKKYFEGQAIPEWVGRKLLIPMNPKPTSALKILFPKDGTKGITLTYREWQNPDVLKGLGYFLDRSKIIPDLIKRLDRFLDDEVKEIERYNLYEGLRLPIIPIVPLSMLGGFRRSPTGFSFPKLSALEHFVNFLMDVARVVFPFKDRNIKNLARKIFTITDWDLTKPETPLSQLLAHPDQKLLLKEFFNSKARLLEALPFSNLSYGEVQFLNELFGKEEWIENKLDEPDQPPKELKISVLPYKPEEYVSKVLTPETDIKRDKFVQFLQDPRARALESQRKKVVLTLRSRLYGPMSSQLMDFLEDAKNPYSYIRDDVENFLNQFVIAEYQETAAQALLATFSSRKVPKATDIYDAEQRAFLQVEAAENPPSGGPSEIDSDIMD
jgi:hypothetical protein